MSRKRSFPFCRALPLGLLLCLFVGETPALGQQDSLLVERGFRLSVFGGFCFHGQATREFCPFGLVELQWTSSYGSESNLLRFNPGSFLPAPPPYSEGPSGPTIKAVIAAASSNVHPDPDDPPDMMLAKAGARSAPTQAAPESHHRGTFVGLLEVGLPIGIEPRYLLEPFVGLGGSYIREGKAEAPNRFALVQRGMPAASIGVSLSARLNDRVDLRFQYRNILLFPTRLKFIDAEGERFDQRVATVSASSLLFGLGIRFPRPKKKRPEER